MSTLNVPHAAVTNRTVDPRQYVTPGTGLWVTIAVIGLVLLIVVPGVLSFGILLIPTIIGLAVYYFRLQQARAALRGSTVLVTPRQFPHVHGVASRIAAQLGMPEVPEVYIADAAQPNAAALRLGGRMYVLLYDEVIEGAMHAQDPRVLDFIIAHELAHHALGHTGMFRAALSNFVAKLSRLDEFTCDAVANAVVGDPMIGRRALTLLTVGPRLYEKVDQNELSAQIQDVVQNKHARKAESSFRMTHPLLLRRMARLSGEIKV